MGVTRRDITTRSSTWLSKLVYFRKAEDQVVIDVVTDLWRATVLADRVTVLPFSRWGIFIHQITRLSPPLYLRYQ
jgi:hypothetical protein